MIASLEPPQLKVSTAVSLVYQAPNGLRMPLAQHLAEVFVLAPAVCACTCRFHARMCR